MTPSGMRKDRMVTPNEAEALAQKHLQAYVNACNCQTPQDVANVLMKVTSVAGIFMSAAVGQDEAVARLQGTAEFIARQPAGVARMETLQ